jgi:thymidylate synthase (FAD)
MKADLIDHMGDDLRIANAARVSFDKESKEFSDRDDRLIHFLAKHDHFTPFTHTSITLRETVPIFVARQRFKHVVGFTYNEVSRRYVDSEPEFYVPETWRKRAENKKQGSSEETAIDIEVSGIKDFHSFCKDYYQDLIDSGVAPEQARMILPQSMMTSYYVTGSLSAFARAYKLRSQPDSQMEIQVLAKEWDRIIRPLFPVSWEALTSA